MAKIKRIEQTREYRSEQCPSCRKFVPNYCVLDRGLKCPRCGLFSWDVVREAHQEVFEIFNRNPDISRTGLRKKEVQE